MTLPKSPRPSALLNDEQDQSNAALTMFKRKASFLHGHPVEMQGYLHKEGKTFKMKKKVLCRLHDAALMVSQKDDGLPSKIITVTKCIPGTRKLEICVMDQNQHTTSFFADTDEECLQWQAALKLAADRDIAKVYSFGPILGKGSYGTVRYAQSIETGETVAIKVMDKARFQAKEVRLYKRELLIMQHVSHPRVVRTYDVYETAEKLFIVLEYMARGMLYDVINKMGNFSEKKASEVMRSILEALVYLHGHDIIHRDLKPENILCKNAEFPLDVKIADFGLAKFIELVDEEHTLGSAVGTPFYVAPEVARRQPYNHACDMWSCGVIMYNLLSGRQPFAGNGKKEVLNKVIEGEFGFPPEDWVLISDEAKSLIRSLLQKEPFKRLTARAALHHPWFHCASLLDQALPRERTMLNLKEDRRRRLRGCVRAVMAASWFIECAQERCLLVDMSKPGAKSNASLHVSSAQMEGDMQKRAERTLSGSRLNVRSVDTDAANSSNLIPASPRRIRAATASSPRSPARPSSRLF